MIGMDFISFVILLVIAVAVSAGLHYGMKYYVVAGTASYVSKVVLAWIGAWLGSPVFGHWWPGLSYSEVYFVPAVLGSAALVVLMVDLCKTIASACK